MRFLIDAQLPRRLAHWLKTNESDFVELGSDSLISRECPPQDTYPWRRWQRGQKCVPLCATSTRRTGAPQERQGAAALP